MKRKKKALILCLLLGFMTSVLLSMLGFKEQCYAADSYSNAKIFFHSTGQDSGKHMEVKEGTIYFATQGKLANAYASDYHTYYSSQGFDVTLIGGGTSVTFAVKIGVSLEEVPDSADVDNQGNHYQLFRITRKKLEELAKNADPVNASKVLSASTIDVYMDTIIVRVYAGMRGTIEEDGRGGLRTYSPNNNYPWIWRFKDKAQLANAQSTYGGHTFLAYYDIHDTLVNNNLQVYYGADGLPSVSDSSSTHVKVGTGYTTGNGTINGEKVKYVLFETINGVNKPVMNSSRMLDTMTLFTPSTAGMSKVGYHLDEKEWITDGNKTFDAGKAYSPSDIESTVTSGNKNICLYANWKPNTYTVIYNANGGSGVITPSAMIFDQAGGLRVNHFERAGYYLPEGEEWVDESTGKTYGSGEVVKNLTEENQGAIILSANWKPCVYKIETEKQGGTGGSDSFYEKFSEGFYGEENCENEVAEIVVPRKMGYSFMGYYSWIAGGKILVDSNGKICVPNDFFQVDAMIYAKWNANQYEVILDKQGGEYGSDKVLATYDQVFPQADAPIREGYVFRGYFTQKAGGGTRIYNEQMTTDIVCKITEDITLYAYWVDEILPEVTMNVSHNQWTNQKISLTAEAWDFGSGLRSLEIYKIKADGSSMRVATVEDLKGARKEELKFTNSTEGAVRYKAVATDMSGNVSESYSVVYYDVTPPEGQVVDVEIEGNTFYFLFDITDGKAGD